jgi:hypothetical protein
MSISFSCNFCSRKYRVDDALGGRKVKCKECGTDLAIPSAGAVMLTDADLAPATVAPHRDLYGLDDDDDPAPARPPARPGMRPARPSGGDWSSRGSGTSMGVMVGTAALVVGTLAIMAIVLLRMRGVAADPAPIAGMPKDRQPNFGPPNFPPNFPPPAAPPTVRPGQTAPGIHLTLSSGKSSPVYSRFGATMPGVEFQAEYHMTGERPIGIHRYITVIKGPRSRATSMPEMLRNSGMLSGTVTAMSQADGPFEMYIEAETLGGRQRYKVSESIPLPWDNTPPPQQQQPQIPQPPRFGQPPNFPNNPGNRGPGMPNIPRFGPRR